MTNKFIMVAYRQYCMNEDGLGHCAEIHTISVAWKKFLPTGNNICFHLGIFKYFTIYEAGET